MALFNRKKKEPIGAPSAAQTGAEKKEKKVEKSSAAVSMREVSGMGEISDVLRNPRITEKATGHSALGVYTFDVAENATKRSVSRAISMLYKVMPKKVRIVSIPSKIKRSVKTGARGISRGGRKAYVYLKKGETITIA